MINNTMIKCEYNGISIDFDCEGNTIDLLAVFGCITANLICLLKDKGQTDKEAVELVTSGFTTGVIMCHEVEAELKGQK